MTVERRVDDANPYAAPMAVAIAARPEAEPTIGIDLETQNPVHTIWTQPRPTIRGIVDFDPTYRLVPLAIITGIAWTFCVAWSVSSAEPVARGIAVVVAIVLGPVVGLVPLCTGGWLLAVTGRWLGGQARARLVRTALGWSDGPLLLAAIPFLLVAALARSEDGIVSSRSAHDAGGRSVLFASGGILQVVLWAWSFVILLKGLAEAHRFSAWRAFAALALTGTIALALGATVGFTFEVALSRF